MDWGAGVLLLCYDYDLMRYVCKISKMYFRYLLYPNFHESPQSCFAISSCRIFLPKSDQDGDLQYVRDSTNGGSLKKEKCASVVCNLLRSILLNES